MFRTSSHERMDLGTSSPFIRTFIFPILAAEYYIWNPPKTIKFAVNTQYILLRCSMWKYIEYNKNTPCCGDIIHSFWRVYNAPGSEGFNTNISIWICIYFAYSRGCSDVLLRIVRILMNCNGRTLRRVWIAPSTGIAVQWFVQLRILVFERHPTVGYWCWKQTETYTEF